MESKPPKLISTFSHEDKPRIKLTNESGTHFVFLHTIVYVQGEGCYTTFYIADDHKKKTCSRVVTCHNLGFYEEMLDYGFVQANQRILFNESYIVRLTRSNEVLLTHEHCLIQVTRKYKESVFEKLGM